MTDRSRFWLVALAALLGVGLTASLGRWQLGRAAEKEGLQARIEARAREPVIDARGLKPQANLDSLHYRRISVLGTWVVEHTVYLDNRQMQGHPGMYVVTPLRIAGSEAVLLVQRGWVARNFQDRRRVPELATPSGLVRVDGLLAPAPSKLYELGQSETGAIRQNLDLGGFRVETGLPLLDLSIQQVGDVGDGLHRDWPRINTGIDKHYGYAFQWFGLCALITLLYVWFQLLPRFRRRQQ